MTARLKEAQSISTLLAGLDDAGVQMLLDAAEPVGVGIGGTTKKVRIGERTVFLKQGTAPDFVDSRG
ncbi:hypothetical protein [Arthrobacter sp. ok362]|uniref:hypothetical protein n=1 Tax=Arthrobacter sp. ok362 TaxID=1761745 RepID=UPI001113CDD4|nr:hypothetical protein [Arthrobacter sp. ok362]